MKVADRKEDWPLTFWCSDIWGYMSEASCCPSCHKRENNSGLIRIYPRSVASDLPDLGLGLNALVCCKVYDYARELPREWWLARYGEKHGYSAEDIKRLQEATTTTLWLRTSSELGSKYFRLRNPDSIVGRNVGNAPRTVGSSRRTVSIQKCPSCGQRWDGEVCSNCGHGAMI